MKKILRITAVLLAMLFMLTACADTGNETGGDDVGSDNTASAPDSTGDEGNGDSDSGFKINDSRYGTALNIDPDALAYMYTSYVGNKVDTSKDGTFTNDLNSKLVKWYEDKYADSGLSDILYNINWEDMADKYMRKTEDGKQVDYSDNTLARASYLIKQNTDIDPYEVWFDECRKDGVNVWLSFRMNDVHSADAETGHDDFFYTAKKNGWLIGNARASYWLNNPCTQGSRNWYPNALNYEYAEVREHFLDIIDVQLGRYDVYGIELDWQRTIWCFPTDSLGNIQYMNDFMENLDIIVKKYEQQYGHEIKVMARIGRDIDENKYFGFDVRDWAKKGLIDVVCPSSYWGATDTSMPIDKWKEELKDYGVDVWAGLECHLMNNAQWQSVETLAGQTAAYLNMGADKMYLYNLFNDTKEKFTACSSLENAFKAVKRSYVVTRSNTTPYTTAHTEYVPLPLAVKVNKPSEAIVIKHGVLDFEKDTLIYIAISGVEYNDIEKDTVNVMYNGVSCTYRGSSSKSYLGSNADMGTVLCYAVPREAITADTVSGSIVFDVGTNLTVNYVELTNGNTRM